MKILITGATGLVGKELGKALFAKGHELIVVSRSREKAELELPFPCQIIECDLGKKPLTEKIQVDAVFHLMGETVASRWNEKIKKEIFDSRVLSTKNLNQSLLPDMQFYLSASGLGYYGGRTGETLTEQAGPDPSFLSKVCVAWEAAADEVLKVNPKIHVVKIRTGMVLAQKGGALEKMLLPFKAGIGGVLGTGRQFMSWIHIHDLVSMMIFAFEKKLNGPMNGCSPEPVTNRDFSATLAATVRRGLGPPVPKFALKLLFGEMADVILDDQKAIPRMAMDSGFVFKFPDLKSALADVLVQQKGAQEFFFSEQYLPLKTNDLFSFFSEAKNLEEITPPSLKFHIKDVSAPVISKGVLINYRLKIHGIPFKWRTLIKEWEPNSKFVDTQLKGPYSLWVHSHEFFDWGPGTLMRDSVSFRLPFGFLGWIAAVGFVKSDVNKIFAFRRRKVVELLSPKLKS